MRLVYNVVCSNNHEVITRIYVKVEQACSMCEGVRISVLKKQP